MKGRTAILEAVTIACSAGSRLKSACTTVGLTSRTVQRWRKDLRDDGRRENRFQKYNALTRTERKRLIDVACSHEFQDMSPSQIVPILAERGIYIASEPTFYRVLKAAGLLKHRSRARAPERKRPAEFVARAPNQVWTWDISLLLHEVRGVYFYLYVMMDIWDRSIVGWRIEEIQDGTMAAELLNTTCIKAGVEPRQLVLHQDNGGPMVSANFTSMLRRWGAPSYSRPGVSDDNPYSESLFRTAKYRPGYPVRFTSIEHARQWITGFVDWYNTSHRHSGIGFVTPMQRRIGADQEIIAIRKQTYQAAKEAHPERWSGNTRNWKSPEAVLLNPRQKKNRQGKAA